MSKSELLTDLQHEGKKLLKPLQPHLNVRTSAEPAPLISVIVCNYNYGRFLGEAIESVLSQTYANFELIVVDDGSTDDSRTVIEFYRDRLIPVFQSNSGQGAAFNAGFNCSRGEIICLLDADDYFHKDKLRQVAASFFAHPEWVQLAHPCVMVNREGLRTGRSTGHLSRGDVRELLLRWGRYKFGITSALAYRRTVLEQVMPIPLKPRAADAYLSVVVPFYGQIGSIDEPLMFYRIHGQNRRAHSDNLAYLLEQREDIAVCINTAAARVGVARRFDIQKDMDYRSFKAVQLGGVPRREALQVLWSSLLESIAIGRGLQGTLEKLVQRGLCVLSAAEGKAALRLGLRGYARFKLSGTQPTGPGQA